MDNFKSRILLYYCLSFTIMKEKPNKMHGSIRKLNGKVISSDKSNIIFCNSTGIIIVTTNFSRLYFTKLLKIPIHIFDFHNLFLFSSFTVFSSMYFEKHPWFVRQNFSYSHDPLIIR